MHLSVFMGPAALTGAQDRPLIDQCLDLSERAAAAGFAMVTFGEQHLNNYEPYSNPFLMAARLSPVLGECWFGTTIVPLVFHDVLRLAEDTAVVDVLTGGRLIVGMSAGRAGFSSDFRIFGLPEDRRDEIFASKLDLLQRTYRHHHGDEPLEYATEWDRRTLLGRMMPVPFRDGGPQLALGTNTDEKMDDAARRGLAVFLGPCPAPEAAAKLARHRAALGDHPDAVDLAAKSLVTRYVIVGRTDAQAWERAELLAGRSPLIDRAADPRSLRQMAEVPPDAIADDPFPRHVKHVHGWYCVGAPDSVTAQLRRYDDLGVGHVNTRFTVGTYQPRDVEESFSLFVDEVLPGLDAQRFAGPSTAQTSPEHRPGVDVMAPPAGGWRGPLPAASARPVPAAS